MFEIKCPQCQASFELDDEFRGAEVECGACSVSFVIPEEGEVGILSDEEEATIKVVCPQCKMSHEVPESARGVEAECSGCNTEFVIPERGIMGEVKESKPKVDLSAASGGGGGDDAEPVFNRQNRSQTLRMSRGAAANTMVPQIKKPGAPASGGGTSGNTAKSPVPEAGNGAKSGSPGLGKGPTKGLTPPSAPKKDGPKQSQKPADAPSVLKDEWLQWVDWVALNDGEYILNCTEVKQAKTWTVPVGLAVAPVVLIPVAAFWGGGVAATVLGLIGLTLWGAAAFLLMQGSKKTDGLVLTNERAALVRDQQATYAGKPKG